MKNSWNHNYPIKGKFEDLILFKFTVKIFIKVLGDRGLMPAISMMQKFYESRPLLVDKIKDIQKEFGVEHPGLGPEKYLVIDIFLLEAYRRAWFLRLDRKPPTRILDLGTGAGYFPWVCSMLGHEVDAIDLDNNNIYNAIVDALNIRRYVHEIKSDEELPISKQYDLITAFMICFNGHHTDQLWGVGDWKSFFRILTVNCFKDSEIFLSFNVESPTQPISHELDEYLRGISLKVSELEYQVTFARTGNQA